MLPSPWLLRDKTAILGPRPCDVARALRQFTSCGKKSRVRPLPTIWPTLSSLPIQELGRAACPKKGRRRPQHYGIFIPERAATQRKNFSPQERA
jgi:hypothetical protein